MSESPYISSTGAKKNYILKIVMLGDCAVGKTSLIQQYSRKELQQEYKPTIGADFHSKKVEVKDEEGENKSVTLQIWDTAGQECFKAINRGYYRDADAAIIVHDLGNESSINEGANYWLEELSKARGSKDINNNYCIALCGNKSDLPLPHAVKQQELDDLVEDFKIDHVAQVSAQEGTGINDMFAEIGKLLL